MTEVREEPIAKLGLQGDIPIAFEVTRTLDVELVDGGLGGVVLTERPVDAPWTRDYDDSPDSRPAAWAARFDVSNWGLLGAYDDGRRIGGAVIAFATPEVHLLRGRRDLAMLWDLRVEPTRRRSGVGTALFRAAESWASARECVALEIETQQINVAACRFYRHMGCTLASIDRFAYAGSLHEVQLRWRRSLTTAQ